MDLHSTDELLGVVRKLKFPQTFLTRLYFSTPVPSDKKNVHIDIEKGRRRLAPFQSPRSQGKIVETIKHETNSYQPAYIKDKRAYDPEDAISVRTIGEALTGSLSPQEREARWIAATLIDQQEMIDRRLEWMASSILRTGAVTISGEGFPDIVIDFQRDAGQTQTLVGAARWGEAGVVPLNDLAAWSLATQKLSGAAITEWIMEPDAFQLFTEDQKTKDLLDTRRGSKAEIESAPPGRTEPTFQGRIGNFEFWTYQDYYEDPTTGVETELLPQFSVIGGSRAIEGRQHYGAIRDRKANYQPRPFFPKMWEEEDPAELYLMSVVAPLLAPRRPDGSVGATVR